MVVPFLLLAVAIGIEVASTAALPRADGFHNLGWAAVVVAGYATAIWLLSVVVQRLPVSVTYAVWAGVGTASIAIVGAVFLGEPLNPVKVVAIALIVVGVVVLNLQNPA
jgi:multidrug transporter EmrE-like cation transporter